jgi:5-oxopent-3-ene-1,2,5-tricarboxylate decarboxylase/2-hydroxyhepta-2,4-diene-1,7-dioate isomerase
MVRRRTVTELRRVLFDGEPTSVEVLGDRAVLPDGRSTTIGELRTLVPCEPASIICVHLNYRSRLEELAYELPPAPTYFQKPPSCLNVHEGDVLRPANCRFLNYEGEFAIVIGRRTSRIRPQDAGDYIAGYTIANDFGLHDFRDTDQNSMVRVKGSDTLGAVGPSLITGWDFRGKQLETRVNGTVVQRASTDDMIWDPHYLLADLCRTHTFSPGDLILTGTPANSRPVVPGDVVEVEVEGLGILRNRIVEGDEVASSFGAQPSASPAVLSVAIAQAPSA